MTDPVLVKAYCRAVGRIEESCGGHPEPPHYSDCPVHHGRSRTGDRRYIHCVTPSVASGIGSAKTLSSQGCVEVFSRHVFDHIQMIMVHALAEAGPQRPIGGPGSN